MRLKIIVVLFTTGLVAFADEQLPLLKVGSETFTNVTVTKVTAADIYFSSDAGMGNAKLSSLDRALQRHFHFNSGKADELEKAHAEANAEYHTLVSSKHTAYPFDSRGGPESSVPVGLGIGQRFPDFDETDLNGSPLSVAGFKGKVTLVDFWATWCGPCRAEMPNVIAAYQKYHSSGLEMIGVSLDEHKYAVVNFAASQGMPWPQYFDGKGWENKLAKQYGVQSIPMSYLLDRNGIIIGKELRGRALDIAVNRALAGN
jgi:thiol-disulfide isomerase/thioredoxin